MYLISSCVTLVVIRWSALLVIPIGGRIQHFVSLSCEWPSFCCALSIFNWPMFYPSTCHFQMLTGLTLSWLQYHWCKPPAWIHHAANPHTLHNMSQQSRRMLVIAWVILAPKLLVILLCCFALNHLQVNQPKETNNAWCWSSSSGSPCANYRKAIIAWLFIMWM